MITGVPRVVALALVGLLLGLVPVAFASPPDPTWVGGYWDDDDFDSAVVFVTGTLALDTKGALDAGYPRTPVAYLEPMQMSPLATMPRTTARPRAPPPGTPPAR
jgi:hypothetical protein